RYPVELRALTPAEGGGWMATIPQLGSHTFVGDGETPEEALRALDELRQELIPQLVAKGVALPEPQIEDDLGDQYSGKLMLRIPRSLHGALARAAERNGVSINKLATQLLAQQLERATLVQEMRQEFLAELRQEILGLKRRLTDEPIAAPRAA